MSEFAQRKFENVFPKPFHQVLYELACSRGFTSQRALARALCVSDSSVSNWYTGGIMPGPDRMGLILVLLRPNDDELDSLVEAYGELLQKKTARRTYASYSGIVTERSQGRIQQGPPDLFTMLKLASKFKLLWNDNERYEWVSRFFPPFHVEPECALQLEDGC